MTAPAGPTISVRASASRLVPPDEAIVRGNIDVRQPTREQANRAVEHAAAWVVGQLTGLGGAVRTAENRLAPLTWTVGGPFINEYEDERRTVFAASAPVSVTVRELGLVGGVVEALRAGPLSVWGVQWRVDEDNPAWPQVRAEAIRAAVTKATDYAAALGATIAAIEQIADTGLLAAGAESGPVPVSASTMFATRSSAAADGGLSVDPEPQEIIAVIEARVVATPVTLG